jgi:cation diffusion facilitator CzcD-associated flavoprotein CzcO
MASNVKSVQSADSEAAAIPATPIDVLIVGAGLSGIGAAVHLQRRCRSKSYVILEAREAVGGTWDLFRFPGVRSDSDMYTLGYSFRPWMNPNAIADGTSIRRYIADTAREAGIEEHIRFGHKVIRASWSGESALWTIEAELGSGQAPVRFRCRFLYICSGYYSYESGYRPRFPGESSYRGTVVHPQFWPDRLDYAGKRVVVVGSGATAVTLVPEMAKSAAHVTMLQRSPSYVFNLPAVDAVANRLRRWLPARLAYPLVRIKNVLIGAAFFQLARRRPELAKKRLIRMVQERLPPGFDVEQHFTPRYNPWDQRVCVVRDGDLFKAIASAAVSVVTDHIDAFTVDGIRLKSGAIVQADIVVLATGLKLNLLGDIDFAVDEVPVQIGRSMAYKGAMLSGVPNLAYTFGYTNASWTLKAELTASYVCRLLRHMDSNGYRIAVPRQDPAVAEESFLDFTSGYVVRASGFLPKQGSRRPWKVYQNYFLDALTLRFGRIDDGVLEFAGTSA